MSLKIKSIKLYEFDEKKHGKTFGEYLEDERKEYEEVEKIWKSQHKKLPLCVLCKNKEPNMEYWRCFHTSVCEECYNEEKNDKYLNKCPYCNKKKNFANKI